MANQELYINVVDPMYARYIPLKMDLEEYLGEKYTTIAKSDFDVSHQNDRWVFKAPESLEKTQLRRLSKEVIARVDKKKAEEKAQAARSEAEAVAGAQEGLVA